jgi:hypothetical protein
MSLHNVSSHVNDELIAIHHPTGTMLEADILFNLPATEQYSRAGGLGFFDGSSFTELTIGSGYSRRRCRV